MSVSIILPTYNELANLKILIPQIETTFKHIDHEIIVVDDTSPDGTANYIQSLNNKNIRLILRKNKEGIGAALRAGYYAAKKEIIISSDSDLSFEVKDMLRLVGKINKGYDLVVGTRYQRKGCYRANNTRTKIKRLISRSGNFLTRLMSGVDITDFSANFRAIRRDVFDKIILNEKTNVILLELVLKTKYKGFKVGEIPVVFKERISGKSKLNLFTEPIKFFLKLIKFLVWK